MPPPPVFLPLFLIVSMGNGGKQWEVSMACSQSCNSGLFSNRGGLCLIHRTVPLWPTGVSTAGPVLQDFSTNLLSKGTVWERAQPLLLLSGSPS